MSADPHRWAQTLDELYGQLWAGLTRGVHDRHAAARHPTLATLSPLGWPQARTVVLRAADKAAGTLDIHTDLRSAKVADLRATPRATLHIWDSDAHLQIRLEADVAILSGADTAATWERVPPPSRMAYGSTPPPGQPVPDALDYQKTPDPVAFAILHLTVQAIDALHLGPDHRRARFSRAQGWSGQWLAP